MRPRISTRGIVGRSVGRRAFAKFDEIWDVYRFRMKWTVLSIIKKEEGARRKE